MLAGLAFDAVALWEELLEIVGGYFQRAAERVVRNAQTVELFGISSAGIPAHLMALLPQMDGDGR